MGTETQKPVWMFRSDDADLVKLKNLLGLKYGSNVTTPVAIGEAIQIAVKQLEQEAQVAEAKVEMERQARQIMAEWTETQWEDFRRRMKGEGSSIPVSPNQLGQDSRSSWEPKYSPPTGTLRSGESLLWNPRSTS